MIKSRKGLVLLWFILLVTLFMSCQIEELRLKVNMENKQIEKEVAIAAAEAFLKSDNVMVSNKEWAEKAIVSDAFPMYLDGIDGVSYYDCKVVVDNMDAGYVIVNVNQTDIPVLEYSTEGPTTTEQFSEATRLAVGEIKIYRYNNFEYIAEKVLSGAKSGTSVIAELGFSDGGNIKGLDEESRQKITNKRSNFRKKVQDKNCNPLFSKEELKRLHQREVDSEQTKGTTRWTSDELNYKFASGWHLPKWKQAKITIGGQQYSVGCSPLAITMCYAYWRQFKGKTRLFNGANLNNYCYTSNSSDSVVLSAVREIAQDLGTTYKDGAGSTLMSVAREDDIDNYGDARGYSFTCDVDYGGDWSKGINAYSRIKNHDQPIAVSMNTEGNEASNHTVAIEGVKYKEYKALLTWYNREMWLLMNYGWGTKRTWVCTYNRYNNSAETETQGFYHFWD